MWTGSWTIKTNNRLVIKDLGRHFLMHQALCAGWSSCIQCVPSLGTTSRRDWVSSQCKIRSQYEVWVESPSLPLQQQASLKLRVWAKRGEGLFLSSGCTTATFTKHRMVLEPVLSKQLWKCIRHNGRTQWASLHAGVVLGLGFGNLKGSSHWRSSEASLGAITEQTLQTQHS